jgi:hypothetical protein
MVQQRVKYVTSFVFIICILGWKLQNHSSTDLQSILHISYYIVMFISPHDCTAHFKIIWKVFQCMDEICIGFKIKCDSLVQLWLKNKN